MCVYPYGLLSDVCTYILMGCSVVCVYPYGLLSGVCASLWAAQ